jgi:hypothetical protein
MDAVEFFINIQKREAEFERRKASIIYQASKDNYSQPSTWKIVFTPHSAYVWFYKKTKKN